jgi:hypothetical protein
MLNNKAPISKEKMHNPNHIPLKERRIYLALSSIILLHGTVGVYFDDIFLPSKRGGGIHLHGESAWIMYAAFLFASLNMLSIVVDHYDRRNNEINYKKFARITQVSGWCIFGTAMVWRIFFSN